MSGKISGRRCSSNVIVSTGPDVCLTPMGSAMVPVAYSSIAFLGSSIRISTSVRDNRKNDFQLNSRVPTSTGHEPGVGKGIVIPGYKGHAFVKVAASTVFSEGWATTRHRDPAMINRPGPGATEPKRSGHGG
jgi:hypothetical protein